MAAKVNLVKVRSLTEFFSAKADDTTLVQLTPRDFAFAPLKPRLLRGKYGLTIQIAQLKQTGWSQVSTRIENLDFLTSAVDGLMQMVASAVELGYLDEKILPTETLQKAAAELEDAVAALRRALEARRKESRPNSK